MAKKKKVTEVNNSVSKDADTYTVTFGKLEGKKVKLVKRLNRYSIVSVIDTEEQYYVSDEFLVQDINQH